MTTARLQAQGITRRFGPVVANDGVDLTVAPGTIHGIVGENGAGKSTLMRILAGLDRPDAGSLVIDGREVVLRSPLDGAALGIGMVEQELPLIRELTLLENLVLGAEPRRHGLIDWDRARHRATELARTAGVAVDWDARAGDVPIGTLQRVAILQQIHRGVDVLILDEPTAVLAPQQAEGLMDLLRSLRSERQTILFTSHKLDEVLSLTDTVTVLRDGRHVATKDPGQLTAAELAELMVGQAPPAPVKRTHKPVGTPRLKVADLWTQAPDGRPVLHGIDLQVHAGELLGIAGVAGNGQQTLVECLLGLRPAEGRITVDDRDITRLDPGRRRGAGLAYISGDRRHEGLALPASLTDNAIAGHHRAGLRQQGWLRRGWLRRRAVDELVTAILTENGVVHDHAGQPAGSLSGGNQQRLVVGRELAHRPMVLVAAYPTRGIDIRGVAFVHRRLLELAADGAAAVVVSEELDELLTLCHRVIALHRGRVAGEVRGQPDQRLALGQLMLGERVAA